MGQRLAGKRVLITASAQGIGRATARLFAEEGAQVVATDVNEEALASLSGEAPGIKTRVLDVLSSPAVESLVASEGPFDVLFNCAGFVHHGSILDCDEDAFDFSIDLNLKSMWRLIRAVLPGMLHTGSGSVVNMSSVASSVKGAPNRFIYGTTKAAVVGLTKACAADYVHEGIRFNAVCPGTVQTPSLDERIRAQGDEVAARAAFISRQPIGRLGTMEEIAQLVLYLASDESGYTTGATHVIDGGWSN